MAALALTRSITIGCRAAPVDFHTVQRHRRLDLVFAKQCKQAEEHAAQLLHDACWKSALEGEVEPVYWKGIRVGSVRKFDSRLRIEMLRAHLPAKFKQPVTANVNINASGDAKVLVIGEAERDELVALRQQALAAIVERKRLALCAPEG